MYNIKRKFLRALVLMTPLKFRYLWIVLLIKKAPQDGNKKIILCISRNIYNKDIKQLKSHGKEFAYWEVPSFLIGLVQRDIIPEKYQIQTEFIHNKAHFKNAEKIFDPLFKILKKKYKIDAVMSANVDYWQDYQVLIAAKKADIPFVALSKEHPNIPINKTNVTNRYKKIGFQFKGDLVLVAGEDTKEFLVNANICPVEKIKITGLPRYDVYRDIAHSDKNTFTLITYASQNYHSDNFTRVLKAFIASATDQPEYNFIIKCKDDRDEKNIRQIIDILPENVEITWRQDLFNIFSSSIAVIGFNSLALMEALLTDVEIVIPNAKNDKKYLLFNTHDAEVLDNVHVFDSAEELKLVIEHLKDEKNFKSISGDENQNSRMALFQQMAFLDPDNSNTAHVEAALKKLIDIKVTPQQR